MIRLLSPAPTPFVLLGIPFHDVTFAEATEWAVMRMRSRRPGYVATANLDFVMQAWRDPELQRILLEADLVVADGAPIVWISRLFGPPLKERVTGSDLVPLLAEACRDNGLSVFNLGAAPGVAEEASRELQRRYPGLTIAGWWSPPPADVLSLDHADIHARLRSSKPDLLLVAFGAPKQEKWINMHVREWAVPLAIGVGGTLDFLAGEQVRAPRWLQGVGLEWFWRMATNPRRLFRRYSGNLVFICRAMQRLLPLRWGATRACGSRSAPPPAPELEALDAEVIPFQPMRDEAEARAFLGALTARPGKRSLLIDLRRATWLSSLELGVLVQLGRAARAQWRRVVLWSPCPRIRHLVETCRLDLYLPVAFRDYEVTAILHPLVVGSRVGVITRVSAERLILQLPLELSAANLPEFRQSFDAQWAGVMRVGGLREVVVDAGAVEFVDSAALGFLVGLKTRAEQNGAQLRCTGFHAAALHAVKLTRLESVLGI